MAFDMISLEMQNIITKMLPRLNGLHFADDIFSNAFSSIKIIAFLSIFRRTLFPWVQGVRKKEIVKKNTLSTDTRFFGAQVVECSGYLFTLFSVLHFSLLFWLSFKRFYH